MICGAQALLYSVLTANFRMVAQGNLAGALVTDFIIATLNYFLIRRIATAAQTTKAWAAYTLGGLLGTTIGLALT